MQHIAHDQADSRRYRPGLVESIDPLARVLRSLPPHFHRMSLLVGFTRLFKPRNVCARMVVLCPPRGVGTHGNPRSPHDYAANSAGAGLVTARYRSRSTALRPYGRDRVGRCKGLGIGRGQSFSRAVCVSVSSCSRPLARPATNTEVTVGSDDLGVPAWVPHPINPVRGNC